MTYPPFWRPFAAVDQPDVSAHYADLAMPKSKFPNQTLEASTPTRRFRTSLTGKVARVALPVGPLGILWPIAICFVLLTSSGGDSALLAQIPPVPGTPWNCPNPYYFGTSYSGTTPTGVTASFFLGFGAFSPGISSTMGIYQFGSEIISTNGKAVLRHPALMVNCIRVIEPLPNGTLIPVVYVLDNGLAGVVDDLVKEEYNPDTDSSPPQPLTPSVPGESAPAPGSGTASGGTQTNTYYCLYMDHYDDNWIYQYTWVAYCWWAAS